MIDGLAAAVHNACLTKTPLRIRGQGSKDFYGQRLQGDVLDLSAYRGIVEYEPSELVITVRAGTPIGEVEAAMAEAGQMLAFEPPRYEGRGTIGGAIATGLSGPRRPYAGAARDFVLGSRVLSGKADDLSFGGRVIKNVAGFDASRLMVGAMGTLGVLLEVSLKSLPRPKAEATLRFAMAESDAIRIMNDWAGKPLPLSATCHIDGVLTVRLSGGESAIKAAKAKLGGEEVVGAETFWNGLRDQANGFFTAAATLWRVSLPATTPPLQIPKPQLIEWGGALRWIAGDLDATELHAQIASLGGHVSQFRAANKSAEVFHPLSPAIAALHRRLKAAFDPHGILNPGRLYDF